jgi:hypothetical protein
MTTEENEAHSTIIVERPAVGGSRHSRRRAICSCGWRGTTFDAQADAEEEAERHEGLEAD